MICRYHTSKSVPCDLQCKVRLFTPTLTLPTGYVEIRSINGPWKDPSERSFEYIDAHNMAVSLSKLFPEIEIAVIDLAGNNVVTFNPRP